MRISGLPKNKINTREMVFISLLASISIIIHIAERSVPNPIPWLRMGWSNMIVLSALEIFGFIPALGITFLRVFIGGLMSGTLLGPTFLLSVSGSFFSLFAMACFHKYFSEFSGLVGCSLVGAYAHNIAQVLAAFLILIKHNSVFMLIPILFSVSLLTGFINGLGAIYLVNHLRRVLHRYF